tara:strand:+ start:4346 stop:6316 length:1971 start_codon:yes stop_codon:yes gene_type:complete
MADDLVLSAEQRDALENIISTASKPARWPHFPQLSADGEWTQWTADPDLPDDEPSTVEKPSWAKRPIGSESVSRHVRSLQHDNLSKGHIRLLKLTNVHFDEQSNLLHGFEQICVPLHAAPEYQALSYCWGNMQLCTGILFTHADGCQRVFRITEDLVTCLYMIYQSKDLHTTPYLWVDQICINQLNTFERSAQVQMMADIYRGASRVVVWLGQESDADVWQQHLANLCLGSMSPGRDFLDGFPDIVDKFSLFNRGWFERVWVFQEVVMAREIKMLVGEKSMSWNTIMDFRQRVRNWITGHPSRYPMYAMLNTVSDMMNSCREEMRDRGTINIPHHLPRLLPEQKCRDPRYRIYGFLGCASDLFPPGFVDYRTSVFNVFRDATRLITSHYCSLDIVNNNWVDISGADIVYDHERAPTWSLVSRSKRGYQLVSMENDKFRASADRAHQAAPIAHPDKLQVQGRFMDSISALVQQSPILVSHFMPQLASDPDYLPLRDFCDKVWDTYTRTVKITGRKSRQSITREAIDTLCCLENSTRPPFPLDDVLLLEESYEISITNEQADRSSSTKLKNPEFMYQIQANFRLIAILESGRLALVAKDVAEVGDTIAILHGLSAPCVLRKVEGKEECTFHGDAFVKGMMRGEAVNWEEVEADTITLV